MPYTLLFLQCKRDGSSLGRGADASDGGPLFGVGTKRGRDGGRDAVLGKRCHRDLNLPPSGNCNAGGKSHYMHITDVMYMGHITCICVPFLSWSCSREHCSASLSLLYTHIHINRTQYSHLSVANNSLFSNVLQVLHLCCQLSYHQLQHNIHVYLTCCHIHILSLPLQ